MGHRVAAPIAATLAATVAVALAAPRVRVSGTVERVVHAQGPCSGGAAVTREEMEAVEARTQRFPLSEATFTVFAGGNRAGKRVTRFKTDRSGRFEVRLPEGMFCIMAGEHDELAPQDQAEPARPTDSYVDADCLRDRALACDAQLTVRSKGNREVKLTLDTFTPCPQQWAQPCWRGPMPP